MKVVGIIPARYGSTRFPGKPLVTLRGRPMIHWVHEAATRCRTLDSVWIATDDERIRACAESFGARVVMTAAEHPSGTDRLAEAAAGMEADVVVNVQGDEPLLDPNAVDAAVAALASDEKADVATLTAPLTEAGAFTDPNVVKAIVDAEGRALWFSRAPIPWPKETPTGASPVPPGEARRHLGLYAYRAAYLARFVSLPPSALERVEGLEQLRILENGGRIRVVHVERCEPAVDTPADVEAVERRLAERAERTERTERPKRADVALPPEPSELPEPSDPSEPSVLSEPCNPKEL